LLPEHTAGAVHSSGRLQDLIALKPGATTSPPGWWGHPPACRGVPARLQDTKRLIQEEVASIRAELKRREDSVR